MSPEPIVRDSLREVLAQCHSTLRIGRLLPQQSFRTQLVDSRDVLKDSLGPRSGALEDINVGMRNISQDCGDM